MRSHDKITLVCCARHEDKKINEWINYNISIGFDEIFLYCNDDDPWPLYKTVLPYVQGEDPVVKFIHFDKIGQQKAMYKDYIRNRMSNDGWLAFIDVDEFVTLRSGQTLRSFLDGYGDADVIHLCWWNFGPGQHEYDCEGFVLSEHIHRNLNPSPNGKVFVKPSAIDRDWTCEGYGTFFHGFGDMGMNRKHRPFSELPLKTITAWGEDFYRLYETAFSSYASQYRESIRQSAYISHFQMQSFEHLVRRAKRKMTGDFADQVRWRHLVKNGGFWAAMEEDNAEVDTFLRDNFAPSVFESI